MAAFADLTPEEQSALRLKRIERLESLVARLYDNQATTEDHEMAQGLLSAYQASDLQGPLQTATDGPWRATWGVFGPFERTNWKRTQTYFEYRISFFKPDGTLITWVNMPYITSAKTLDGSAPTEEQAFRDAHARALRKLNELRKDAEPVKTGQVELL